MCAPNQRFDPDVPDSVTARPRLFRGPNGRTVFVHRPTAMRRGLPLPPCATQPSEQGDEHAGLGGGRRELRGPAPNLDISTCNPVGA